MDKDPQTYKVCIFGDLGYFHGNSTESLIRNGLAGKFDFIVHVGDIAYDLHSENGAVGDKYMNQLEPLIATIRTGWLDMPGLEPLFLQYGVDMGFWGHEHSYERMYPIADRQFWNSTDAYNNPPAPVYVITGSAGCHSPYAQFSDNPWPFSAARINDFGYSILTVANSTHLHMEQISIEKNDSVVDEVWVVKDHGYTHSPTVRAQRQGWKFPQMKCHPKNIACRMSLQQLNEEL
ncbi:unnamed protein product [Nippostrongylus brasiliensis]|uniref:Acid phosphatase-related (inferred by orthology to a S. mansoni protein) n=1 Tax=Nippostrongylus brasiliensis TaxID=27835 RepID=A0A0N4Y0W6_NIPBR|nr:unnamed protein product [Nippostrongylus brasiliensis]